MHRYLHLYLCFAAASCASSFAQTDPVPEMYRDIYANMNTQISAFDSAVRANWNGSTSPVAYAPQLEAASSAEYTALLGPNYYTGVVLPQLEELQALGAQGVKVWASFPILYQPFYAANPSQYQSFANFYQRLATDVRARGMKLIVESTVANQFPGDYAGAFTQYYQTLSWSDYVNARAQNALAVAQLMRPDYLSLLTEPDTEASYTGQTNAGTVAGSTQLLQAMLNTLQNAGVTEISLGAGAGTWTSSLTQFIQSYTATPIQYVDVHIYPVNGDYLMNALTAADMAHAAGKQVALSAVWDFKVRDSELGVMTLTQTSARDPFSFWAPVDTAFLQALADYSNYEQVEFISPFWSRYFFAYLDYTAAGSLAEGPVIIASHNASQAAMLQGSSSSTGLAWLRMSLSAPDTIPPVAPMAPTATAVYATSVMLTWPPTSDNVGVSAYHVYRNGTLLTTTGLLAYHDESASPGTTYSYTLTAADASGNISPRSMPLTVQTANAVPPTVPTQVIAQAPSSLQVDLSWTASTGNAGIAGYEIYRGSSLTNMSPFAATPATSYSDTLVSPSLTYYYAVLAFDRLGNESDLSPVVSATPPQEPPPSTPGQPVAAQVAYNEVGLTWPPSTSGLGISGYLIYRGPSPSALTQISNTIMPVFLDNRAMPSTTYYYAVAAYDINGVFSLQSAAGGATTPQEPAPGAPAQLAAQAAAYNQVALSWAASTGAAPIWGYAVYRGTSPTALSILAGSKTTSYIDTFARPSTTYYYAVASYDTYGLYSPQSPPVSAITPAESAPAAPAQVTIRAPSYSQVSVSWAASTSAVGIGGYVVYRGTSPTGLSTLAGSKTTSYSDTLVSPSKTYYYAVAAYDKYGLYSPQSVTVSIATPQEAVPAAPRSLTAQAAYDQVALSWGISTSPVGIGGYAIYRGTSPSSLSILAGSKTASYTDAMASPSKTYYYAVLAYDIYGLYSSQSPAIAVATPAEPAPTAPGQVAARAAAYNEVTLSWTTSTSPLGLRGYAIYRGTSPTGLSAVGQSQTNAYTDTRVAPNTTYRYAVIAYDAYGLGSPQSAEASTTTPQEPAPPVSQQVSARAIAYNRVALQWAPSTGGATLAGYAVCRGGSPTSLKAIGTSKTNTYPDTNVAASTTYCCSIAAYDIYGVVSAQSAVVAATIPAAP